MPTCPYFKKCSGCQLLNLTYEKQLQLKQVRVIRYLGKYCHVDEIIGMEAPQNYRNKSQYLFGIKDQRLACGIYQSATGKISEVDSCMLEEESTGRIVKSIKKLAIKLNIPPYDIFTGKGFLRHVLVRKGFTSGQIMVVIVTTDSEFKRKEEFKSTLLKMHPEITTLVWNVNKTETPLMLGEKSEALYGDGYISDTLCGLEFRISPRSFYQINPIQTEKLYAKARELAELSGNERVIDAYCGTGTIGLTMASEAREIIGVEINSEAVLDAKANAKINKIENVKFYNEDAGKYMKALASKGEKIDVVITDPPRAGCSKDFLQSLVLLAPKRVVYISCNPETQAKDLFYLVKNGYRVTKIQPYDLFPHTSHIETVVQLIKNKIERGKKNDRERKENTRLSL